MSEHALACKVFHYQSYCYSKTLTSKTGLAEKAISLVDGLIKLENGSIAEIEKEVTTADSLMGRMQRGEAVGSPAQPARWSSLSRVLCGCLA